MTKRSLNPNARKALDEMKLEIAAEIGSNSVATGNVGKTTTRSLVEMGEKQFADEDIDTFYPI